jgi:16S rRNA processing protein RimM
MRLLRPQGRRGELLAEPLTDQTELMSPGRELWLAAAGALVPSAAVPLQRIEEAWQPTGRNAGRWVLKLAGCDSIGDAEALSGKDLLLPFTELPALGDDTWFVRDLVGCALFNGERSVGTVVGVEYLTASDGRRLDDAAPLLVVELPRAAPVPTAAEAPPKAAPDAASEDDLAPPPEPELVPFRRAWLDSVDLDARRIVMHLPDGLLGDAW